MEYAIASHPGLKRELNEDSGMIDPDNGITIVADGMGGHAAGELASAIAVTTTHKYMTTALNGLNGTGFSSQEAAEDFMKQVTYACRQCYEDITAAEQSKQACQGLGTTLVAAAIRDNKLIGLNLGDSRLYRYRAGTLKQVSSDHSVVQEIVNKGLAATYEEACNMAPRNQLTKALGGGTRCDPDLLEVPLNKGDILLLCSDGLTDMVGDDKIQSMMKDAPEDLQTLADGLVAAANANGGVDNVTVTLIRVS